MARNNSDVSNRSGGKNITNNTSSGRNNANNTKYYGTSPKYFKSITPPLHGGGKYNGGGEAGGTSPRISPSRASPPAAASSTSPLSTSPRTSPGLLAGHYAGCKFTEPPLPSALPLPPQHWMQQPHHHRASLGAVAVEVVGKMNADDQLAQQLKVLLKVQA